MIVLKAIETVRIVQKDVGIEDEIFHTHLGSPIFFGIGKEEALFVRSIDQGRTMHKINQEVSGLSGKKRA